MPIHHATAKRALSLGVKLVENDDNQFTAFVEFNGQQESVEGDEPKATLAGALLRKRFGAEYPLNVRVEDDSMLIGYEDEELLTAGMGDFDEDQVFADALEAWTNYLKENPEVEAELVEAEEEEEAKKEVVARKYKDEYKARGNANHCGDWLAEWLTEQFKRTDGTSKKPYFHYSEFRDLLVANEVDMSGPWAKLIDTQTHGWQGRFRMNGRQVLEVKVIENKGVKLADGGFVAIPKADYRELLDRHPRIKEDMEIAAEEALHAKPARK